MTCSYCGKPILEIEVSISGHHRECLFRCVAGSAAHLRRQCACYGGTGEDPPGLTLREAARLAWDTAQALMKAQALTKTNAYQA
jgi:hypothetical protein